MEVSVSVEYYKTNDGLYIALNPTIDGVSSDKRYIYEVCRIVELDEFILIKSDMEYDKHKFKSNEEYDRLYYEEMSEASAMVLNDIFNDIINKEY